ncbi:MAG TPA: sugar ABC transporter permease [Pyrinomonadaceae bacterium]|jgi:D-xylose transport system permease protein
MSEHVPANEPPINRPPVVADAAPPTVDAQEGVSQIRIGGFKIPTDTLRAYTMVFALLLIWAVFHYTTDQTFLGARNLSKLLQQSAVTGVLSVGMLMVIVSGQIDLSVGSVVGLAGGLAAMTQGWGVLPSLAMAIVIGIAIGAIHGVLVAYVNIPAFIVTLGGMLAWAGVTLGLMKGETIPLTLPAFRSIGEQFVAPMIGNALALAAIAFIVWSAMRRNSARRRHNLPVPGMASTIARIAFPSIVIAFFIYLMNKQGGVPISVLIMLVVAVIGAFVTQNTTFGRYLYAIGGNPDAARLSGISLRRHILSAFCIMGALAGLAALIHTARQGAAAPEAGKLMELDAIAACVIGGTSLLGGRGTVFGAILGALIMSSLDNGMSLLDYQPHVQPIVKGLVLVAAVGFDMLSRQRS